MVMTHGVHLAVGTGSAPFAGEDQGKSCVTVTTIDEDGGGNVTLVKTAYLSPAAARALGAAMIAVADAIERRNSQQEKAALLLEEPVKPRQEEEGR